MDGLKFPTVGAELRSGCIAVELSLRTPKAGGCPSVAGAMARCLARRFSGPRGARPLPWICKNWRCALW